MQSLQILSELKLKASNSWWTAEKLSVDRGFQLTCLKLLLGKNVGGIPMAIYRSQVQPDTQLLPMG